MPFVVTNRANNAPRGVDQPLSPMNTGNHHMVVQGSPFMVRLRGTADEQMKHASASAADPHATMSAGGIHDVVIQGAAQISLRDANAMRVAGLDSELMTQGCAPQQAIISHSPFILSQHERRPTGGDAPLPAMATIPGHAVVNPPFLVSHYGTNNASSLDAPVPAVTTVDRHELVEPSTALRVEDCYFRMLQPHEIGAAMAFPADYIVGGNKRDRVKQYGNAVTPPVMDWIVRQCAATLAPELGEDAA
jgi:site-specific DNA-cytosine methylase